MIFASGPIKRTIVPFMMGFEHRGFRIHVHMPFICGMRRDDRSAHGDPFGTADLFVDAEVDRQPLFIHGIGDDFAIVPRLGRDDHQLRQFVQLYIFSHFFPPRFEFDLTNIRQILIK